MRSLAVATLVAALAIAVAAAALAATPGNRVVGSCLRSQVRPTTIVIACADANTELTHLRWSSFGGPTAKGAGDYAFNNCSPNCAAGHFERYPVAVTLSDARRCPDGYRDYQVAVARYSSTTRRPSGAAGRAGRPGKLSLFCPLKG